MTDENQKRKATEQKKARIRRKYRVEKSLQIDLFDDYAIFSVKDTDRQPIAVTAETLGLPNQATPDLQTSDSPIEKDGDRT